MSFRGSFTPPGDKSISHRVLLIPLLSEGEMAVSNLSPCADVMSSLESVRRLGLRVVDDEGEYLIKGAAAQVVPEADLDCGNSGTTTRLLMGLLAGRPGRYRLDGDESLQRRPMERVAGPLRMMGAKIETSGGRCPVSITGGSLKGIEYALPVASAQLKSAILLAGIQASGLTVVREPAVSRDHTERLIRIFGGEIRAEADGIVVAASRLRLPENLRVPGDASSAAFFLCASAITPGSDVIANGVLLNETRTGFLDVLKRMGVQAEIEVTGTSPEPWGNVRVRHTANLRACVVTKREIPLLVDEIPILALTATQAEGRTVFQDVGELRVKETDRVAAVMSELGKMGADISVETSPEGWENLVVNGPTRLSGADGLDSFGDHRIAMTLRLAARQAGVSASIREEESVRISYPSFPEDLEVLWK